MIKSKNIDRIKRSTDGRFVITYDSDIEIYKPTSASGSLSSESSDDGGFLPRRNPKVRTFSHRPRDNSYLSEFGNVHNGRLLRIRNQQPLLQIVPIEHHTIPPTYQNIDSFERSINRHTFPHTTKVSRIISSSPTISSPVAHSSVVLSPQTMYFSDLSSVLQASSRDPSFPTLQNTNINQLQMLQERYSQELPSLRAIHEETRRMAQNVYHPNHVAQIIHTPFQYPYNNTIYYQQYVPDLNYQQQHHQQQQPLIHHKPKSKLLPRHVRITKSAPELNLPHNTNYMMEISPESQSSSSGFGSRNTSQTQQNQSSRSGSANIQHRSNLPPYRSPPKPQYYYQYDESSQHSSPYTMEHWLDLIKQMSGNNYLLAENQMASDSKAVDVGSVDLHYEFDQTPTPTASTPTRGTQDDMIMPIARQLTTTLLQTQSLQPYQRKRVSKYENIEARVQAMKEEFHEYRKRQAMQRNTTNNNISVELESAC